ncbi:unnamed protein product [Vitrella brassicaformis CCMP3155]|uniref:Uncharacterized protein n=2 Tax=Vitrella brassicaformis TaxID=1169539 RepID=A0A0G4H0C0_VITBC|nr:unnamed protein product [Vitrella brassicaformis CCMP3155]|mmetsp:Transcript_42629/g.106465  ORF Transcript_42629/g.106465 Transcript_42629/m.106465 type:complete len:106 (+) Transcript_42629:131-448(+)|eukprot:CEM36857.1 unnamed protein product [Vitrella brassicaformis CCMP3155]
MATLKVHELTMKQVACVFQHDTDKNIRRLATKMRQHMMNGAALAHMARMQYHNALEDMERYLGIEAYGERLALLYWIHHTYEVRVPVGGGRGRRQKRRVVPTKAA